MIEYINHQTYKRIKKRRAGKTRKKKNYKVGLALRDTKTL